MNYEDDDMIAISSLTHYVHCPRRCALVHLEQVWDENVLTVQGNILHEKADSGISESRRTVRIVRSLRLQSQIYGITGIADVVEFHKTEQKGIVLPKCKGLWKPYPVEYKRGASHNLHSYEIQLTAQTLCLEEMLHCKIDEASLYLGISNQRLPVAITENLKEETITISKKVHELLQSKITPLPDINSRCSSCSLLEYCITAGKRKSARKWLQNQIESLE